MRPDAFVFNYAQHKRLKPVVIVTTPGQEAQTEPLAPIDLLSCLVSDELARRGERLLERWTKQAQFRDSQKTRDNFDSVQRRIM